jgi:hypothetical protein
MRTWSAVARGAASGESWSPRSQTVMATTVDSTLYSRTYHC